MRGAVHPLTNTHSPTLCYCSDLSTPVPPSTEILQTRVPRLACAFTPSWLLFVCHAKLLLLW